MKLGDTVRITNILGSKANPWVGEVGEVVNFLSSGMNPFHLEAKMKCGTRLVLKSDEVEEAS